MRLYAGDRAPKAYELNLTAEDVDVDFTDVDAWELRVRYPDGSHATWTVDQVSNLTTTTVTLKHLFVADGSDLPRAGAYDVIAWMTMPSGGALQSDPVTQFVEESFGARV